MKLREHYATLLGQIDDLASKVEQNKKATLTFDECETIAAAFNALNRACKERDRLVEALKEAIALTPPDSVFLESRVALLRELGEAP